MLALQACGLVCVYTLPLLIQSHQVSRLSKLTLTLRTQHEHSAMIDGRGATEPRICAAGCRCRLGAKAVVQTAGTYLQPRRPCPQRSASRGAIGQRGISAVSQHQLRRRAMLRHSSSSRTVQPAQPARHQPGACMERACMHSPQLCRSRAAAAPLLRCRRATPASSCAAAVRSRAALIVSLRAACARQGSHGPACVWVESFREAERQQCKGRGRTHSERRQQEGRARAHATAGGSARVCRQCCVHVRDFSTSHVEPACPQSGTDSCCDHAESHSVLPFDRRHGIGANGQSAANCGVHPARCGRFPRRIERADKIAIMQASK